MKHRREQHQIHLVRDNTCEDKSARAFEMKNCPDFNIKKKRARRFSLLMLCLDSGVTKTLINVCINNYYNGKSTKRKAKQVCVCVCVWDGNGQLILQ